MNSPAENRRRIAADQRKPLPKGEAEERWAKMIRNSNDILFAEAQGRLIPRDPKLDEQRYGLRRKDL